MGTALTERQVRLLKRLTGQVVLALDADAAGLEAAVRGHDVVREAATEDETTVNWAGLVRHQETAAIELRVAVLPEGRDPDDYIRADPEQWRALIEGAEPVLDFRLNRAAASRDLTDPRVALVSGAGVPAAAARRRGQGGASALHPAALATGAHERRGDQRALPGPMGEASRLARRPSALAGWPATSGRTSSSRFCCATITFATRRGILTRSYSGSLRRVKYSQNTVKMAPISLRKA